MGLFLKSFTRSIENLLNYLQFRKLVAVFWISLDHEPILEVSTMSPNPNSESVLHGMIIS